MNNLTDRQKAAIYDDAVKQLDYRRELANHNAQDLKGDYTKSYKAGQYSAYKFAHQLLTENEFTEYLYAPTWKDKAKDLGTYFLFGAAVGCGAYALFYLLKFTFETFGLI